ncbi:MAG: TetR/AcrR family transcriptional regulator [Patescibacteria group bacterium]
MSTTREKLLHTSRELMLQNGYHAVSVDEICVQANVKKGSFYHFFDSKMNLALQTMEDDHQESKSVCDTIFSSLSSPTERSQIFFEYIYRTQADLYRRTGHVCGALPVILGLEMACHDEIRQKSSEIICFYEKYYKTALRDLIDTGDIDRNTNVKNVSSNVSCFLLGKMTIARIHNSLVSLKNLETGISNLIKLDASKQSSYNYFP